MVDTGCQLLDKYGMSISKDGIAIETLDQWEERAGPKREDQWAAGRSAMELARSWLDGLPAEVSYVLEAHPCFGKVDEWRAEPEVALRFDNFPGEPRNSDLVVDARDAHGNCIVSVEGRADEEFGDLVSGAFSSAMEASLKNPNSNGLERIRNLVNDFLYPKERGEPSLKKIRYQLLTACAGMLAEAKRRNVDRALMLVHEFKTDLTTQKKLLRNSRDLSSFIHRLSRGRITEVKSGEIYGPFELPCDSAYASEVKFFVGKASIDLRC